MTTVSVSIDMEIRPFTGMVDRWGGPDLGLIWCWERGRQMAELDPLLAAKAKAGELMVLGWKGGVDANPKYKTKSGVLKYLAQWQGLRGENLDIDTSQEVSVICSLTGVVVMFKP